MREGGTSLGCTQWRAWHDGGLAKACYPARAVVVRSPSAGAVQPATQHDCPDAEAPDPSLRPVLLIAHPPHPPTLPPLPPGARI